MLTTQNSLCNKKLVQFPCILRRYQLITFAHTCILQLDLRDKQSSYPSFYMKHSFDLPIFRNLKKKQLNSRFVDFSNPGLRRRAVLYKNNSCQFVIHAENRNQNPIQTYCKISLDMSKV